MKSTILAELDRRLDELSPSEQLWLIERLAQNLRKNAVDRQTKPDLELKRMSEDPEIQAELLAIEREFASTETDGLEMS